MYYMTNTLVHLLWTYGWLFVSYASVNRIAADRRVEAQQCPGWQQTNISGTKHVGALLRMTRLSGCRYLDGFSDSESKCFRCLCEGAGRKGFEVLIRH